jgi:hypothetical protein
MEQYPLLEMYFARPTSADDARRLQATCRRHLRTDQLLIQLASLEVDKRHENDVRTRIAVALRKESV